MEAYAGNWTLKTNEDFESFLTHVQYGWMARKAALASSVVVKLKPIDGGKGLQVGVLLPLH